MSWQLAGAFHFCVGLWLVSSTGLVSPEYLVKFCWGVTDEFLFFLPHSGQFSAPPHPLLVMGNSLSLHHVLKLNLSLSFASYRWCGTRIWAQLPPTSPKGQQGTFELLSGHKATMLSKESLTQVLSVTKLFYFAVSGGRKLGHTCLEHSPVVSTLRDLRTLS